jgi:hypothetical protein
MAVSQTKYKAPHILLIRGFEKNQSITVSLLDERGPFAIMLSPSRICRSLALALPLVA